MSFTQKIKIQKIKKNQNIRLFCFFVCNAPLFWFCCHPFLFLNLFFVYFEWGSDLSLIYLLFDAPLTWNDFITSHHQISLRYTIDAIGRYCKILDIHWKETRSYFIITFDIIHSNFHNTVEIVVLELCLSVQRKEGYAALIKVLSGNKLEQEPIEEKIHDE